MENNNKTPEQIEQERRIRALNAGLSVDGYSEIKAIFDSRDARIASERARAIANIPENRRKGVSEYDRGARTMAITDAKTGETVGRMRKRGSFLDAKIFRGEYGIETIRDAIKVGALVAVVGVGIIGYTAAVTHVQNESFERHIALVNAPSELAKASDKQVVFAYLNLLREEAEVSEYGNVEEVNQLYGDWVKAWDRVERLDEEAAILGTDAAEASRKRALGALESLAESIEEYGKTYYSLNPMYVRDAQGNIIGILTTDEKVMR